MQTASINGAEAIYKP